jgi:hypothetical protein
MYRPLRVRRQIFRTVRAAIQSDRVDVQRSRHCTGFEATA